MKLERVTNHRQVKKGDLLVIKNWHDQITCEKVTCIIYNEVLFETSFMVFNADSWVKEVWKVVNEPSCKKCNDTGIMNVQGPNKPGYKTKVCDCKAGD